MKPIQLALHAFGPYAGEQVFDFRLLGERSFFLIHGPTGAGKSTILDAMCFALYGETSGGEREAAHMRSDLADAEVPTDVTFDFSLGEAVYRITRSPEQDRPRKRGTGNTRQRATATLWRRSGVLDDSQDGTVLVSQWSQVTEAVEGLLGFRSDQFRQVVMLPQGQFRQFLLADSKERQRILEVLFQTEVYRRIEEALKEAARETYNKFEDLRRRKQIVLEHASVDSEERLLANRTDVLSRIKALAELLEELRKKEKEAGDRLARGREALLKITECRNAEDALEKLKERTKEIEIQQVQLDRAKKALGLRDVEANLRHREKELEEASRGLRDAQKKVLDTRKEKDIAEKALVREQDRETDREGARRRLDQLNDMMVRVRELREADSALKRMNDVWTRVAAIREGRKQSLDACRSALDETRKLHELTRESATHSEQYRLEFHHDRGLYRQAAQLRRARKKLEESRRACEAASAEFEKLDEKLNHSRERLELLETAWFQGQAAILARQLTGGAPCPVCGSTEHPSPAHSAEDLPTETALKKARKDLKDFEESREKARQKADQLHLEVHAFGSEVRTTERDLGAIEDLGLLKDKLIRAWGIFKDAQKAGERLAATAAQVKELETHEANAEKKLDKADRALQRASIRKESLEAVVKERAGRISADLGDATAVANAISRAQQKLKSLNEAMEKARDRHVEAGKKLAASSESFSGARLAERTAHGHLHIAVMEFDRRLEESGFRDRSDFESARRKDKEIEALEAKIQNFHGNLKAAQDRLSRAKESAEGFQTPDIETLEKALKEVKTAVETAMGEHGAFAERARQMGGWLDDLRKIAADIEVQERRYAVVGKITDVANGRNSQGITFQRFVLAALLDDVLDAASKRLRRMSRGRFDLHRAGKRADQRTAGGLDLLVYDSYTGTMRPVNTLSGGESFLASLSLALGLADVVQSYAGGIKLETIFVDEGFGSLDPESLDLAFQTLLDLQESNRLVGIISHVPELKDRIDTRLEVTPAKRGSVAKFVV